jgi:molecular chaperone DnaK (HSP70)
MAARFAVGIDLGTTNTVVAFAPIYGGEAARVFALPQLAAPGQVQERALLPSVLYAPLEGEPLEDPWADGPWVIGELARRRGVEVPGRVVASSKSWLVHSGIDRQAAILPWGAPEEVPKLSPIDAAARLLAHVRAAWDARHPQEPLAGQEIVLTVPASFDEVARELTLEGARRAGVSPRLLEEPQAAFYDWMDRAGAGGISRLLDASAGDALVLVVDVGGGTTDLSLMHVAGRDRIARVAVGPHLLLGGDNMDLALAHACEPRLAEEGTKLDPGQFAQLVSACRIAKECLLGETRPDDYPIAVAGRGARLVGAARTTRVSRDEAERIVLDGFVPLVPPDARLQRSRSAVVAFGLPYERDVAMTRHIAAFLARHLPPGTQPHAVLLNGGVFRAERIAARVVDTLAAWRGSEVLRLPDADPDLAVARGAVAYALARLGRGIRIGGGTARGYFVALAGAEGRGRAVCVVPRGAEEGTTHRVGGRSFALAVGEPVRFELLASDESDAGAGDVVELDEEHFARLPPLATFIEGVRGAEVRVGLQGELTSLGTLDLACVEVQGTAPCRFRLAFQLGRDTTRSESVTALSLPRDPPASPPRSECPRAALDLLDRVFGKPLANASGREAKDLLRELERELGERARWPVGINRALFDAFLPGARARRRSADHERVFWLLTGWCIRPGFGTPGDPNRITEMASLFEEKLAFPAEARGWQQFWIAWRRAAGGLDETMQTQIRDFADAHLAPRQAGRAKRPKKPALSLDDALEMASSLERVPSSRRSELGGWVLERTWTDRDPRLWSALGRLGARVPAYASVHYVVAPHIAERWVDHLLREKWEAVPTAVTAAVQLARLTGDRARDLGDRVRREVEQRLVAVGARPDQVRAVREVVSVEESERAAFFVDALPLGLRLVE